MDGSRLLIRSDLICARPFTFCEMLAWPLDCQEQFVPMKNGLAHWKLWLHRKSMRPWRCASTVTRHIKPTSPASVYFKSPLWCCLQSGNLGSFSPPPYHSNKKPLSWHQDSVASIFPNITGCHSGIFKKTFSKPILRCNPLVLFAAHLPYLLLSTYSLIIAQKRCDNPRWQ